MKKLISFLMILLVLLCLFSCKKIEEEPLKQQDNSEKISESGSPDSKEQESKTTESKEGKDDGINDEEPLVEEVTGVTIPAFSITINGIEITQETVAECPMYMVVTESTNSVGTVRIITYVGVSLKDVLEKIELSEKYIWLEATAVDGYRVVIEGDEIHMKSTLLAMTKDGSPFADFPWFAPCSDKIAGNYLKSVESILVNTVNGPPDISA